MARASGGCHKKKDEQERFVGDRVVGVAKLIVFADQSPLTRRGRLALVVLCSCSLRRVLTDNAVRPYVPCSNCCGNVLPEVSEGDLFVDRAGVRLGLGWS
jgi:hypothetical protein